MYTAGHRLGDLLGGPPAAAGPDTAGPSGAAGPAADASKPCSATATASTVRAYLATEVPVANPAAFDRRRWHLVGSDRHPVAAALLARSAGMRPARSAQAPYPAGTAVLLGDRFGWRDNATLLDGVAATRRDGGRLVLLHLGAGGSSLLQVAEKELGLTDVLAVELPTDPSPRAVRVAVALANSTGARRHGGQLRIGQDGRICRQVWDRVELPAPPAGGPALRPLPVAARHSVLVTGGLGGLGIRVAAVLAARRGMHAVLLDAASPARLPFDVAGHLARLGGAATVLSADLTDPTDVGAALSTLDALRVPPVTAVVHCAGVLQGRPLDRFDSHDLALAQQVKVDGLGNVLAGIDRGRLRHLVTFGSITAEAPHRSMASYALANELLRRETLRAARELPACATVAAQWSLWSGAGMAHQAGAVAQARRMGMTPVSLRAGMSALLRLLAWPAGPEQAAALVLDGDRPT